MTKYQWNGLKLLWEQMDDKQRWVWLKLNQDLGLIVNLDNDQTFITNNEVEDEYLDFDDFIGWKDGVCSLLKAMNIEFELV